MASEVRCGWSYRVNEDGFRIGGFSGVVKARVAKNGRWAWRERFRCDHNHISRRDAAACAVEVRALGR